MQNETISKRIRNVRKALDLTQQAFADRLGISRGNIATYETREGSPSNSVINLICREFHVNETWLRTGDGSMFTKAPNTPLEELVVDFYLDPFDEALVDEYLHLSPNNRKAIRTFFYRVLMKSVGDGKPEELLEAETGYPTPEEAAALIEAAKRSSIQDFSKMKQEPETSEEIAPPMTKEEQEARAEADEFYQQILQEKRRAAESSASQSATGNGGTK